MPAAGTKTHIMTTIGYIKLSPGRSPSTAGEVRRVTKGKLDGSFGRDRGRRLVVELRDGDILCLRPERCRTGTVELPLQAIYRTGLLWQAQRATLEKARARKARLAELRERRAIARAEKRLKANGGAR
jgi:hypothetical protein